MKSIERRKRQKEKYGEDGGVPTTLQQIIDGKNKSNEYTEKRFSGYIFGQRRYKIQFERNFKARAQPSQES